MGNSDNVDGELLAASFHPISIAKYKSFLYVCDSTLFYFIFCSILLFMIVKWLFCYTISYCNLNQLLYNSYKYNFQQKIQQSKKQIYHQCYKENGILVFIILLHQNLSKLYLLYYALIILNYIYRQKQYSLLSNHSVVPSSNDLSFRFNKNQNENENHL